jgi:hypothetical protein
MTSNGRHRQATALDPPGPKPRRWQCAECKVIAVGYNALAAIPCTAPDPPPCDWCGQTPECARDCVGVAMALSGVGVNGEVRVIDASADEGSDQDAEDR